MKSFMIFLLISTISFAKPSADMTQNKKAIEYKIMKKIRTNKSKTSSISKIKLSHKGCRDIISQRKSFGFGSLKSEKHNFDWMIFSDGWYWESSDTLSNYYYMDQNNNDETLFLAILSLNIYKSAVSANFLANDDADYAKSKSAEIAAEQVADTVGGNNAIYNSYSFEIDEVVVSYDNWYFTNNGITYCYSILTTLEDWNENGLTYLLMQEGLVFEDLASVKHNKDNRSSMFVKYYETMAGKVNFDISYDNGNKVNEIFVYDVKGKLVRRLFNTSVWDGCDELGNKINSGFYVTNIKMKGREFRVKVFKRH